MPPQNTEHNQMLTFLIQPEDAGMRLDQFLVQQPTLDCSRAYIKKLIQNSNVWLDQHQIIKPSVKLHSGSIIELHLPPPITLDVKAEDIPLHIHYEDSHIAVIEKPAGMVVHPAAGHPNGTLVNALLYHCNDLSGIGGVCRPGIVHRLDMHTSGLLVVAKHDHAHKSLAQLFKMKPKGELTRCYQAIIKGNFREKQGTIETFYGRHPTQRLRFSSRVQSDRRAITHFWIREQFSHTSLIELQLQTGRTHQIRVHMADLQRPLVGDPLYHPKPPSHWPNMLKFFPRQALHAYKLSFRHPVHHEMLHFESPLPKDIQELLENKHLL